MHSAKVAAKIRAQIRQFLGEVSMGLPHTAARLVREVIFGVQSRASVRLSEIARALEEEIGLKTSNGPRSESTAFPSSVSTPLRMGSSSSLFGRGAGIGPARPDPRANLLPLFS